METSTSMEAGVGERKEARKERGIDCLMYSEFLVLALFLSDGMGDGVRNCDFHVTKY